MNCKEFLQNGAVVPPTEEGGVVGQVVLVRTVEGNAAYADKRDTQKIDVPINNKYNSFIY